MPISIHFHSNSTADIISRYTEHMFGRGSRWTKLHKPVRLASAEAVPASDAAGRELKRTAELMIKYGVNNVRGAMFCKVDPFESKDIEMLTAVIGHSLGVKYFAVEEKLSEQIGRAAVTPSVKGKKSTKSTTKSSKINKNSNKKNTTSKEFSSSKLYCNRCKRTGHLEEQCFATTLAYGISIKEDLEEFLGSQDI